MSRLNFQFGHFPHFLVAKIDLKLTSSYSKLSIFDIFELLSTQKVNVGVGRFSLAMLNSTFWAIFKHCVQCVGVEKLRL